jgi:hypothetical protein
MSRRDMAKRERAEVVHAVRKQQLSCCELGETMGTSG